MVTNLPTAGCRRHNIDIAAPSPYDRRASGVRVQALVSPQMIGALMSDRFRRVSLAALFACTALSIIACGAGSTADRGKQSARDGAERAAVLPVLEQRPDGTERLTFTAEAFDRAPTVVLDTTPLAVAGGSNGSGDFDLTYVRDVRLLSDNRLVAYASIRARLMVFGADGKEQRIIGRLGKGPGEFMRPGGVVVLPGDTLFLNDMANNRLNWVLPDGRFARTPAMRWTRSRRDAEHLAGMLADGRVVLHSNGIVSWDEADTVFRSTATVLVQPLEGAGRTIASIPDLAQISVPMRIRGRTTRESMVLQFTPLATIVLWDSLVTTSSGDSYTITMRSPSGTVLRELVIPLQRRPVTAEDRERALALQFKYIENSVGEGGGGDTYTKDEQRQSARLTPTADSMPIVVGLFTSPDGTLWVVDQAAASGTRGTVATSYRRDGAMTGRLQLAMGAKPVAFGNDRVVLRVKDENDVVALHVHRLCTTSCR